MTHRVPEVPALGLDRGARYVGCRRPILMVAVALRRGPPNLPGGLMQTRFSVVFATLLLLPALAAAATSSRGVVLQPDKLVILSTTDVKGTTSPCGCHIPKGGLSRRAGLADSIRAQYG